MDRAAAQRGVAIEARRARRTAAEAQPRAARGGEARPARAVRVALVDDHPVVLYALEALLGRTPDLTVIGTAAGGAALRLVAERRPDLVVLDLQLPDLSGVEVARRLRAAHPRVRVLVFTGADDPGDAAVLQRLGASGYLRKSAGLEAVVAAVCAVAAGQTVFPRPAPGTGAGAPRLGLTPREHDVLRLLLAGRRNREIAAALHVTENTVEYHVGRLLAKLGARSRGEAAARARRLGLGLGRGEPGLWAPAGSAGGPEEAWAAAG